MECSELRRPLLTMDGLPLHSHPSLQLTSGADDRKDDWLDERFVAIKRSNSNPSLGSRQGKMSVKLSRGEVISSPTKLTKPKTGSFYAHLFHKQCIPAAGREKLAILLDNSEMEQAAALLQQFMAQKFVLDSSTLKDVMKAGIKHQRSDISISCFLQATTEDCDSSSVCKTPACPDPDLACYNALIEAYGCAGKPGAAADVRERLKMRKMKPNGETYNSWIRAAILNDDQKMIRIFLLEMDRNGFIYSLSRDIKHSLGEEFIKSILEKGSKKDKEQTSFPVRHVQHDKRFDLQPLELQQPVADITGTFSAQIFDEEMKALEEELSDRIATLEATVQILLEEESDPVETEYLRAKLSQLEMQMNELNILKAAAGFPSSPIAIKPMQKFPHENLDKNVNLSRSGDQCSENIGSASIVAEIKDTLADHRSEPSIKVIVKPKASGPRSISSQVDFVIKRPPFLVVKTISATPKSYSTGEFMVVVTVMLNEAVGSHRGDRITMEIRGFQKISGADCELPIFGLGSRLCVNGSAKWVKSSGLISMDIADDVFVPSENPAVFRFSLNVDPEVAHPSLTPTIAIFNRSRSFDTGHCKMDGEILQYIPTSSKRTSASSRKKLYSSKGKINNHDSVLTKEHNMEVQNTFEFDQTVDFIDWGSNLGSGEVRKQSYCFDRGFVNSWRPNTIKIFLSACVSDMQKERAQLTSRVLPSIQKMCEAAQKVFILVDLRNGQNKDDRQNEWILKILLEEAKQCHYFLCMIGNDYGWHQPIDLDQETFEDALRMNRAILNRQYEQHRSSAKSVKISKKQNSAAPQKESQDQDTAPEGPELRNSKRQSANSNPHFQRMRSQRLLLSETTPHPSVHCRSPSFRSNLSTREGLPQIVTSKKFPEASLSNSVNSPTRVLKETIKPPAVLQVGGIRSMTNNNLRLMASPWINLDAATPTTSERKFVNWPDIRPSSSLAGDDGVSPIIFHSDIAPELQKLAKRGSQLQLQASESRVRFPSQSNLKPIDVSELERSAPELNSLPSNSETMGSSELLNSSIFEYVTAKLPHGSDIFFFLNQLHAMAHGHLWILDHINSGLIELEIIHKLRCDISAQHRCLVFFRVQDGLKKIMSQHNLEPEHAAIQDSVPESQLCNNSIKRLLNLKKKLKSGQYGKVQVFEYFEPTMGSDLLRRELENLLKSDWLKTDEQQQKSNVNINLLRLEEHHRSFALRFLGKGFHLHLQQHRILSAWLTRSETDSPFLLYGAHGSGKSAFLAQLWKKELANNEWGSNMIHFAEVDPSGIRAIIRCCAALTTVYPSVEYLPGQFRELCATFSNLQAEEGAGPSSSQRPSKALCIIDSIEDLEDEMGEKISLFEYLPKRFAPHVKMVLSTSKDRGLLSWPITHQWTLCELTPLSKAEAENLISIYIRERQHNGSAEFNLLDFNQDSVQASTLLLSMFSYFHYNFLLESEVGNYFCSSCIPKVWANIFTSLEKMHGLILVQIVLTSILLSRDGMKFQEILDFGRFAIGRMSGQDGQVNNDPLVISAILWPFHKTKTMWLRGNLINFSSYLKPSIEAHYNLDQATLTRCHEQLAEFFSMQPADPCRLVRETPYHLMMASDKNRLKLFLCHPQWSVEMISRGMSHDMFVYWRYTGKMVLSNSYSRVLFKPQCWGCSCRRTKNETWVEDYIRQGQLMHLKASRIADSLEKEIIQRTGKKHWFREDILEHIRFHSFDEKEATIPSFLHIQTENSKQSTFLARPENEMDWEDKEFIQSLRIALQIARDSISLVTVPAIEKVKLSKGRISKTEELSKIIPKELSKIKVMTKILLMLDLENSQKQVKSQLTDKFLDAEACEINVESVADLGISSIANLPLSIRVDGEVMTAIKVQNNTLTVIRSSRRKQIHQSCILLNFSFRLCNDSKFQSLPSISNYFASSVGVEASQVQISTDYSKQDGSSSLSPDGTDSELACCIRCTTLMQAGNAQKLIQDMHANTLKGSEPDLSPIKFEIVGNLSQSHHHPLVYAEVVIPNRKLAVDKYWCAHISYLLKEYDECEIYLSKCVEILEQIFHHEDHMLVQCKTFSWLLLIERGVRRTARERAQELLIFEKDLFQLGKRAEGPRYSTARTILLSRQLLKVAREADDFMNSDKKKFEEKLQHLRGLLTPCTLFEIESASFLQTSEMWVSVHIEEARDLLPMDLTGTNDPFCTVSINNATKQTLTHMRTLNVRFDEELVFYNIQPDPDIVILMDVWDWDGPGRQDLIGYAQTSLKNALDREGECVVFALSRGHKGKGVQADGIKVGTSGLCGYISVVFKLSNALRQALIYSKQRTVLSEAVQHRVMSSDLGLSQDRFSQCVTLLEPETWDETAPVSNCDEDAWIGRLNMLQEVSNTNNPGCADSVNAAKAYFEACNRFQVSPLANVLEYLEFSISRSLTSIFCFRTFLGHSEISSGSVLSLLAVVEFLSTINCLELGSCKHDWRMACDVFNAIANQTNLNALYLQSNYIGDSLQAHNALKLLFVAPSCNHLTDLCIADNKLNDFDLASLLSFIPEESLLERLNISHNNAKKLSAIAIGHLIRRNKSLQELDCSWNQIGSDSQCGARFSAKFIQEIVSTYSVQNHCMLDESTESGSSQTKGQEHCRTHLLHHDTDGRWARHFLQSNAQSKAFEGSLRLLCKLFDCAGAAESFLSAYSSYLRSAQAIQEGQNNSNVSMNLLLQGKDSYFGKDFSDNQASQKPETGSDFAQKKVLDLKLAMSIFQAERDSVFRSRDILLQTLKDQSIFFDVQTVLPEIEAIRTHPLFTHLSETAPVSAMLIIFSDFKKSKKCALQILDLSWNNLGHFSSVDESQLIADCLSSESCHLKHLNLSHNNIYFTSNDESSMDLLVFSIAGSTSLQQLNLDGNVMKETSCYSLMQLSACNPRISVSCRCCDRVIHPDQFNPKNPFGKYALILEDESSRNLVRSLISSVCRQQGNFKQNTIYHSTHDGIATITIPVTEHMKWEHWNVPMVGTAMFEFIPGMTENNILFMPDEEFETFISSFTTEISTEQRRRKLLLFSKGKHLLKSEQLLKLSASIRDLPEQCFFACVQSS